MTYGIIQFSPSKMLNYLFFKIIYCNKRWKNTIKHYAVFISFSLLYVTSTIKYLRYFKSFSDICTQDVLVSWNIALTLATNDETCWKKKIERNKRDFEEVRFTRGDLAVVEEKVVLFESINLILLMVRSWVKINEKI